MKLITSILLIISITTVAQTKRYHSYEPTASDNVITRWNIPKDSLKFFKWYVEETSDKQGRVTELKFMYEGKVGGNFLCYLPDIVRYSYPDDMTIVEFILNSDGTPMIGTECEMPCKTIYKLDKKFYIIKAEEHYCFDNPKMKKEGLKENLEIEKEFLKKQLVDSTAKEEAARFVSYFLKSYTKLNRRFPLSKKAEKENLFSELSGLDSLEYEDALKCRISN